MDQDRGIQQAHLRLLATVRLLVRVQFLALMLEGGAGAGLLWMLADAVPAWSLSWALGLLLLLVSRGWLLRDYARLDVDDSRSLRGWLWRLRWVTVLAGSLWAMAVWFVGPGEALPLVLALAAITLIMVALDRLAVALGALPLAAVLLLLVLTGAESAWALLAASVLFVPLYLFVIQPWTHGQLAESSAFEADLQSVREAGAADSLHARIALAKKDILWLDWHLDDDRVDCSPYWHKLFSAHEDLPPSTVSGWLERIHPDDLQLIDSALQHHLQDATSLYHYEYRLRCHDGSYQWLSASGQVVARKENSEPLRRIDVHIDISAWRSDGGSGDFRQGLIMTDAEGKILAVNEEFSKITGYSSREALGQTPRLIKSNIHDKAFYEQMWVALLETGIWQGEIWNRRKNGQIYQEWLEIHALRDGNRAYYIGALYDLGKRRAAQEAVQSLAFRDPLTALPNRRLLLERLEQMRALSQQINYSSALVYLDLDRFKEINDSMGHAIGDLLLDAVAGRLRRAVRSDDTVARLGGDEFVILLKDLGTDRTQTCRLALEIGSTLQAVLKEPYCLAGRNCTTSASIGILPIHDFDRSPQELLHRADLAMYEAKRTGRNCVRLFQDEMETSATAAGWAFSDSAHQLFDQAD